MEPGKIVDIELTNAFLLKRKLSEQLMNAGLKQICLSVSDIHETYEKVHKLDFDTVYKNIKDSIAFSEKKCTIKMSIVICNENRNEIETIKSFWRIRGITNFVLFDYINRSGNLDIDYYFTRNDRYMAEAENILRENGLHKICLGPLVFNLIGWNGNYYLCSNEFAKSAPLGPVAAHGIKEVDPCKKSERKQIWILLCPLWIPD